MEVPTIHLFFEEPTATITDFFKLYPNTELETVVDNEQEIMFVDNPEDTETFRIQIPVWYYVIMFKNIDVKTHTLHIDFSTKK